MRSRNRLKSCGVRVQDREIAQRIRRFQAPTVVRPRTRNSKKPLDTLLNHGDDFISDFLERAGTEQTYL